MTILACRPWAELASLAALHGLRARLRMILGAMRTRLRGNVRRPAALEGRHCSDKFPGPERAKKRAVVRGRERTPDRKRGASGPGAKPDVGQAGEDEIRAKGPSSLVSAGQLRYGARWESDGRRARARAQTQAAGRSCEARAFGASSVCVLHKARLSSRTRSAFYDPEPRVIDQYFPHRYAEQAG